MTVDYTDANRRRSRMMIAAGVITALVVAGTVFVVLRASGVATPEAAVETREVVVAARDIASRKPIEEGDLAMRTMPADATNAGAFSRMQDVLGRVSGVSISNGQLITTNLLASTTPGQAFSILEPGTEFDPDGADLRAVSVNVPDDRAVAGGIQAGQRIDLIATLAVNPELGQARQTGVAAAEFVAGPTTKVTLQNLSVLSKNGTLYILRADLATVEKIAELQAAGGQFTLALRPDPDTRLAETEGATLDSLIEEFRFRIPRPARADGAGGAPSPAPTAGP